MESAENNKATIEALAIAIDVGIPVLLWGPPGTGKTSVVRALAEARGMPAEIVVAAIHDPTDFSGLPVVSGDRVRLLPPGWAVRAAEAGRAVLFLDEVSTAPPAVQAALLRVVLERTVGELALGDGVRVVAAANPPDQAADGWDLAAPLANRFCHLDWVADAAAFADGLSLGWPAPVAPRVPENWEEGLPVARGSFAAFISARPALLSGMPSGSAAGRAWPSPRSWEMGCRLWAAAGAASASRDARHALLAGCVGPGAAAELDAWARDLDLPDPENLLAAPGCFGVPERADRAMAILSAVVSAVAARPSAERWRSAWEVIATVAVPLPDVAATAGRALLACRPEGAPVPEAALALAPVLREAGLFRDAA